MHLESRGSVPTSMNPLVNKFSGVHSGVFPNLCALIRTAKVDQNRPLLESPQRLWQTGNMSTESMGLSDALTQYLRTVGVRESAVAQELREWTRKENPWYIMQISPEQGALMALLVQLTGAKKILEIGTFTGYSALWMAGALPEEGRLLACDISDEWLNTAARYWEKAGIRHRIETRIGPALETLAALREEGAEGSFDMAFIDADKANYDAYYENCLRLVRPGGLIAIDNVLWSGKVLDEKKDEDTAAIAALNQKLVSDDRVEMAMSPIGDGLTLCVPRSIRPSKYPV